MRHSSNNHSYSPSDYDDDMCLKPPILLWLALIWLSRAIMLPIAIGLGHVAGVNPDALSMLRDYWQGDQLIPAAISLPVLFVCCRRLSTASKVLRWVWARGRALLILSVGLDIALAAMQLRHQETADEMVLALSTTGVDFYLLAYLLAARRVRDTFLDFP